MAFRYYDGMPRILRALVVVGHSFLVTGYVAAIFTSIVIMRLHTEHPLVQAIVGGGILILVALSMLDDRRKWAKNSARMEKIHDEERDE